MITSDKDKFFCAKSLRGCGGNGTTDPAVETLEIRRSRNFVLVQHAIPQCFRVLTESRQQQYN
jgi:hypothetical protein